MLLTILRKVWKELLGSGPDVSTTSFADTFQMLSDALQTMRVLLVLDSVWKSTDVEKLMVTRSNADSRVLLTATSKRITREVDVHALTFCVSIRNQQQSMKLFCQWVFKSSKVPKDKQMFTGLAMEMSKQCGQLPLALRVIGSMAATYTTMTDWTHGVQELSAKYKKDVHQVLQVSFEKLDEAQRSMFFCVVGYPEDYDLRVSDLVEQWMALQEPDNAKSDVDALAYEGYAAFGELLSRSLVMMDSSSDTLQWASLSKKSCYMHDVVRDMGLKMARVENEDVAQRRRLLFPCMADLKGKSIMARELSMRGNSARSWPEGLRAFNLVSLISRGTSLRMPPLNLFLSTNMRMLDMSGSTMEELPQGIGQLKNLEVLRLDECAKIKTLPNGITKLQHLVVLSLRFCFELVGLPKDLGRLTGLRSMYVTQCQITHIPNSIGELTQLRTLDLSDCKYVAQIPDDIRTMTQLQTLDMSGCTRLTQIPESIVTLTHLQMLNLARCNRLAQSPDSIRTQTQLQMLDLIKCHILTQFPDGIITLTQVQSLDLSGYYSLTQIPDCIGALTHLQKLDLFSCKSLTEIPGSIGTLVQLRTLNLSCCQSLAQISDSIGTLTQLQELILFSCESLNQIPDSIGLLTQLKKLDLRSCKSLTHITDSIWTMAQLQIWT